MFDNSDYILELLTEYGMISPEQIQSGWDKVSETDGALDIVEALVSLEFITKDEVMAMLAQQYGMESVDLTDAQIPEELIALIPPEVALKYNVVPYARHDDAITIAMSDPTDVGTLDSLRYVLNCVVDAVIAPANQIKALVSHYYGSLTSKADAMLSALGETGIEFESMLMEAGGDDPTIKDDAPIIRLVSQILTEAYEMKASDIHLEPMEKRYRVRYRIDGVLREVDAPPKYLQSNITSRLKIMSKMDISEKRIPQDGRINLKMKGKEIDLRVSTIPTTNGESIVMRILDKASIQLDIPKLGFYADDQAIVNRVLSFPDGIFLVTGPTGSGKTTSLYAFLNTINTPSRKIITAEDPIEYQLSGINQVQVDARINFTFAAALRSMLRQAPNVIMVGEIRDYETASIAINASLTGHMVFSTLHTNDAPGAITRLIDMGVQPFLVASSVRAVMAQRLLRRVCSNCAEPVEATEEEKQVLQLSPDFLKNATLKKGRGCTKCGGTGYKGRTGIYEIFMITDDMQRLIFKKEPTSVIREEARKNGMRTLRDDGLRKAAAGTTTLAEVIFSTVGDEDIEE